MNDVRDDFEQEDLQELVEDSFDPERFYRALSNALAQLANFNTEAA